MIEIRKKFRKLVVFVCVIMISAVFALDTTVYAKENMNPGYEVKFLLDSEQVLNSDKLLKKTYRNMFETGSDYSTIGVLYLETEERDFGNQGWVNRIRIKEDASEFELTYKKRYAIENGNVEEALNLANQEGFDISDTNYEAEVDWGYSKMTLSLSCNKTKSNKGYDELELPKKKEAISIIKDKMPGKEDDWLYDSWGTSTISSAKKAGPLYYTKYTGEYNNYKVVIEIWPIEDQTTGEVTYITELSFKEDDYQNAARMRSDLMSYLEEAGILLHEDSLKTQTIMDAYLGD